LSENIIARTSIRVVDLLGPQTVTCQGSENVNESVKSLEKGRAENSRLQESQVDIR
jgi:hypothetical protein